MKRVKTARFTLTELLGLNSPSQPRCLDLRDDEQVIGRSERADLVLPVRSVSRRHAAVWATDGMAWVKDLGSQSGTFVNSVQVREPTELRAGDLLSFASNLVFLVNREESEVEVPDEHPSGQQLADSPLAELALSTASPDAKCRRYVDALNALSTQLGTIFNEAQLLSSTFDAIERAIPAERFFAMLGDDPGALTIVARKLTDPDRTKQWSLPSKEILRRAMAVDKPVISFDAQSDERFCRRTSIAMSDVHSAICVGLRLQEVCLGVLYADNHVAAGLFSLEDGAFLSTLARIITIELLRLRGATLLQEVALHRGASDGGEQGSSRRSHPGAAGGREEPQSQTGEGGALAAEIDQHLVRLDGVADKVAEEQGPVPVVHQLRAECRRVRAALQLQEQLGRREHTAPGLGARRR